MPFNAFVRPKHFPPALLSEVKRPQKPLQSLFGWKVSNRNAAACNKKLLGSMTFACRAKECFDSCEQNIWTCSVVVRCQNLIVANVGTSSTRPILFRHLKCHGQVRYGPMCPLVNKWKPNPTVQYLIEATARLSNYQIDYVSVWGKQTKIYCTKCIVIPPFCGC